MMTTFTVDIDIIRNLCNAGHSAQFRISASGGGLHIKWTCPKKQCATCRRLQEQLDDPSRREWDRKRPPRMRNVLWETKGKRKASTWHQFKT